MTDQRPASLPAISELAAEKVGAWFTARGEPGYRTGQLLQAVFGGATDAFAGLTDLPVGLREDLSRAFRFSSAVASDLVEADGGRTAKALHQLADGQRIESVWMRYPGRAGSGGRATVCVSSQAGCAVGCPFCATGQAGFGRQLTAAEIVDQVLFWRRARRGPGAPSHLNVVFMGMGEPLNNTDRVFEAIHILTDERRGGVGARHLTVSTSGVVPGIERMVEELPQVNLAISLHAPDDALRDTLVPINRKWPIDRVLAAGRRFAERTRRRVSLEYVLIEGINDTLSQADGLSRLAAGWLSHVNLIPLNPTPGSPWSGTPPDGVARFAARLRQRGIGVTVRDTRGREIEAACGQLHAQLARSGRRSLSLPAIA